METQRRSVVVNIYILCNSNILLINEGVYNIHMLSMSFRRCLVKVMEVEWGVRYQNKSIFSTVHATWCRSCGVWHKEKWIGRKEITHHPILKHSSHNISGLPPRGHDAPGNPLLDRQMNLSYSLWLYIETNSSVCTSVESQQMQWVLSSTVATALSEKTGGRE